MKFKELIVIVLSMLLFSTCFINVSANEEFNDQIIIKGEYAFTPYTGNGDAIAEISIEQPAKDSIILDELKSENKNILLSFDKEKYPNTTLELIDSKKQ